MSNNNSGTLPPFIPNATWGFTIPNMPIVTIPVQIQLELDLDCKENEKDSDGCVCKKCGEFYPYADPPEPDKFHCYGCRVNW